MKIAIPELGTPQMNYYKILAALDAAAIQVTEVPDPADYDGLVIPGGWDIDPARYGCENCGSEGIRDDLDTLQFAALDAFVQAGKPVLGICRGHQLICAYFGKPLIQHLPTAEHHVRVPGSEEETVHSAAAIPGSRLFRLYGEQLVVNSSHHQAAAEVPEGLRVTALSDDGVIEGLEHKTLPLFSVQWHPERMCREKLKAGWTDGEPIFREFLSLCERKEMK